MPVAMPRKRSISLRCPICRKPVKSSDSDFPFCSERCRLVDLGKWARGEYVISSPLHDTSEAAPEGGGEEPDENE